VGGFPVIANGTPCADTGHDGMPHVWGQQREVSIPIMRRIGIPLQLMAIRIWKTIWVVCGFFIIYPSSFPAPAENIVLEFQGGSNG
jgi:hypothetical protein